MAFNRLQKLGEAKFQRITNQLMRGTPPPTLARLIQQEWRDEQKVSEETLIRQLEQLHTVFSLRYGPNLKLLKELIDIAIFQKARMGALLEEEEALPMLLPGLSAAINDYAALLSRIQKIRFDLGLDEYKRRVA